MTAIMAHLREDVRLRLRMGLQVASFEQLLARAKDLDAQERAGLAMRVRRRSSASREDLADVSEEPAAKRRRSERSERRAERRAQRGTASSSSHRCREHALICVRAPRAQSG